MALLAASGCAVYLPEQESEYSALAQDTFSKAEWRVVLFRWPQKEWIDSEGETNRTPVMFMPYMVFSSDDDHLHGGLPRSLPAGE
jgi:hypothetical protein